MSDEFRRGILESFGADPGEVAELLAYGENHFVQPPPGTSLPLPDEPFVAVWEDYAADAAATGDLFATLCERLVQLRFPIREGISREEEYLAATRRGVLPATARPSLVLEAPIGLELHLHPTPAGRIPILVVRHRADFERLVQAFLFRNEPKRVPPSMGAAMIAGYNNWDRVRRHREAWERDNPGATESTWQGEFAALVARKSAYQDRFVILSDGPYSGIPADALDLGDARWRELSLAIRREHECAHYLTRRLFSSMKNRVHDELLADYAGIAAAAGHFRADWFLRFLGLEDFPDFRAGGRLENYRGDPPLSEGAFRILQRLVREAALHCENACEPPVVVLCALTNLTVEELAAADGEERLGLACASWTASATRVEV